MLIHSFWPGPLTLILPRTAAVPDAVTAGLDTVAVRFPSHPVAQAVIRAAGVPIAAPSANLSGHPSPTTFAHVVHDLEGRVDAILDGGPCGVGLESTVAAVEKDCVRVLRPGGISPEMLQEALPGVPVVIDPGVLRPVEGAPRSPGMKYRHYAPTGALTIFEGEDGAVSAAIRERYDAALAEGKRPLILALEAHLPEYGARRALSLGADAGAMAHAIFARLRDADAMGADVIFSEAVASDGIGLAVMNRLGRAAAFHIEKV